MQQLPLCAVASKQSQCLNKRTGLKDSNVVLVLTGNERSSEESRIQLFRLHSYICGSANASILSNYYFFNAIHPTCRKECDIHTMLFTVELGGPQGNRTPAQLKLLLPGERTFGLLHPLIAGIWKDQIITLCPKIPDAWRKATGLWFGSHEFFSKLSWI